MKRVFYLQIPLAGCLSHPQAGTPVAPTGGTPALQAGRLHRWQGWTLGIALTVLTTAPAWAQPTPKVSTKPAWRWAVGLGGLAGFPGGDDFGTSIGVNAWFAFRATSALLLELNAAWTTGTVQANPNRLSGGRYQFIPIQAGFRVGRSFGDWTFLYLTGGGAYTIHRITVDDSVRSTWDRLGFEVQERVDPLLRLYVGLGGLHPISNRFLVSLDLRFVIGGKTSGRWSLQDRRTQTTASGDIPDVSTGGLTFRGGLAYAF